MFRFFLIILVFGVSALSNAAEPRSYTAKRDFKLAHPCPANGKTSGACPGEVLCRFNAKAGVLTLEYLVVLGLEPARLNLHLTHKAAIALLRQLDRMREEITGARPTKAGLN